MSLSRRRFLAITSAAAIAAPARARTTWRGRALGAEATIALAGPRSEEAITAALDTIRRMERLFSLYDPSSALSRLNRTGTLDMPPEFAVLVREVSRAHLLTRGLFDPTVQAPWQALLDGQAPDYTKTGWHRVRTKGQAITLEPGMALTLNGIAQGFATDRVQRALKAHGQEDTVVNIGEYAASGRAARIALGGTGNSILLKNEAVATSDRAALVFQGGQGHVLHPGGLAVEGTWQTATVVAKTAARADALSTALTLSTGTQLQDELLANAEASRILLEK